MMTKWRRITAIAYVLGVLALVWATLDGQQKISQQQASAGETLPMNPRLEGPGPFQKTFYGAVASEKSRQSFDDEINTWVAKNSAQIRVLSRKIGGDSLRLVIVLEYEPRSK